MSFDTFMWFKGGAHGVAVEGESTDKLAKDNKAFEIKSFSISAENNTNIGSSTSGAGGAGKVNLDKLSFTKDSCTASIGLFKALTIGAHFDEVTIEVRRSGGDSTGSGKPFMVVKLMMVVVSEMEWGGSDGDDQLEDSVVIDYGAIQIDYFKQNSKGMLDKVGDAMWSRVLNQAEYAID